MVKKLTGGGFGRFRTVTQLASIVREVSIDDVRRDAELRPVILIVAQGREQADDLGHRLVGWNEDRAIVTRTFDDALGDYNRFDVIVAFDAQGIGRVADLRAAVDKQGALAPVVRHDAASPDDEVALEATRRRILELLPDRAMAFGRAFPPFRMAATSAIINATAMANAQFALVTNIPAVVPFFGSLLAAGADLLVLTKNQIVLLFKVAAIHGRDLRDTNGVLREIVPVVASGLIWRTIAREAAAFLPLAAGTLPKVAIAYAGTVVAGRGADYYYRFGYAPTREQRREFYRQATTDLSKVEISAASDEPPVQARTQDRTEPAGS